MVTNSWLSVEVDSFQRVQKWTRSKIKKLKIFEVSTVHSNSSKAHYYLTSRFIFWNACLMLQCHLKWLVCYFLAKWLSNFHFEESVQPSPALPALVSHSMAPLWQCGWISARRRFCSFWFPTLPLYQRCSNCFMKCMHTNLVSKEAVKNEVHNDT